MGQTLASDSYLSLVLCLGADFCSDARSHCKLDAWFALLCKLLRVTLIYRWCCAWVQTPAAMLDHTVSWMRGLLYYANSCERLLLIAGAVLGCRLLQRC